MIAWLFRKWGQRGKVGRRCIIRWSAWARWARWRRRFRSVVVLRLQRNTACSDSGVMDHLHVLGQYRFVNKAFATLWVMAFVWTLSSMNSPTFKQTFDQFMKVSSSVWVACLLPVSGQRAAITESFTTILVLASMWAFTWMCPYMHSQCRPLQSVRIVWTG